ncbi:hypothetical protein [Frankia sp. CiP3]|uniref:hypothetical protein n=1 Tax=Frankia sp. CiP3 TaxID=2880971 RepID=UPI001EF4C587|nr:hypothetical protein [Frankia sp. CiP3]
MLAAYRGMWADWVAVAETSDYQNPRLTAHVSGEALSLIYKAVYANKRDGLVTRGTPTFSPWVSALTPTDDPNRATVVDCADDGGWLHYRLDGRLEDQIPGGRHHVQALAVETSGTWKIDVLVIDKVGSC